MVVLVTGARSGIGRLVALEAARRGHSVIASVRDLGTAGDLIAETQDLPLQVVALDVTKANDRERAVRDIIAEHGRIDVLVNNAGLALGGLLELVSEEELRKQFEINVFAVWSLTQAVLPHMRSQRSGTVLMVSSMSGRMAMPGLGAYAGSKFALEGMSEAWRHELRGLGIRVVLVEPGPFKTDIWKRNEWVATGMNEPGPDYASLAQRLRGDLFAKAAKNAEDPQIVAKICCDAMEHGRPHLRYPVGQGTFGRELTRRFVPFRVVEWAIDRALRGKLG